MYFTRRHLKPEHERPFVIVLTATLTGGPALLGWHLYGAGQSIGAAILGAVAVVMLPFAALAWKRVLPRESVAGAGTFIVPTVVSAPAGSLVLLYTSTDPYTVQLLSSALAAGAISHSIEDEALSSLFASMSAFARRVLVAPEDFPAALAVLQNLARQQGLTGLDHSGHGAEQ